MTVQCTLRDLFKVIKSPVVGKLQNHLDTWCKHLGTDDDVVIPGENANCNDRRYARHDGQAWRCWSDVVADTSISSCISDDKTMVKCGTRGTGERCSRNNEILKLISDYIATGKECLNINILRLS